MMGWQNEYRIGIEKKKRRKMNCEKCQRSVTKTKTVVLPMNLGPCLGSLFLYLLSHDTAGSIHLLPSHLRKTEVQMHERIESITALPDAEISRQVPMIE